MAEPQTVAVSGVTTLTSRSWYLYLIETLQGKLYTGITTDIDRRFKQHKSGRGGAKFFRTDPPLQLRLSLEFADRASASKAEYRIKQLTHKQKLALIDAELDGSTGRP